MDWTQIVVTLIATVGTVAGLVIAGRFALLQMQAQLDATLELLQTNLAAAAQAQQLAVAEVRETVAASVKVSEGNSQKLDVQGAAVAEMKEVVSEVQATVVEVKHQSDGMLSTLAEQAAAARVETERVKKQAALELGSKFLEVADAKAEGVETGHKAGVASGVEAGVQQGLEQAAAEARSPTENGKK